MSSKKWNGPRGSQVCSAKLTEDNVLEIKRRIKDKQSLTFIAQHFAVSIAAISRIKNKKTWRHVK